jgi:hypothetical protein
MRMLPCLVLIALSAPPALAEDAAPGAGAAPAQVTAPHAEAQPGVQDAKPKKKRVLACPACRTNQDPSFAIRPAAGQTASTGGTSPAGNATDVPGSSASPPPVNFSFSGSGDGSRSNRYSGGVRVGTSF